MRALPAIAMPGTPMPFDRDARRRGLELRVGVALDAWELERARHLAAHGVRDLWLGVTGEAPAAADVARLRAGTALRVIDPREGRWLPDARAAAAAGAGWLATGETPEGVLRELVGAEAEIEVGVVLASALRRSELARGQIGATGPVSLRTLMERYIAIGVSHFALMPVTSDLDGWAHRVCAEVTDLDGVGAMPCGC